MSLNIPVPSGLGISYGGYSFDSSAQTTSFDLKTVPTQDGRAVKWIEVSVTIRGYVTTAGGASTSAEMNTIRKTLQTNGLAFTYSNGVGNFSVNVPGGQQDVQFGPFPQLIRFDPRGGNHAARVIWSVTVRIPECPGATAFQGIAEFNYKLAWQLTRGLTRRTITGFLVIANNFVAPGSRTTRDSADNYRELIAFPVPLGMHRLNPQNWSLSDNRSRLDFTLVDESIPNQNVYPPGVVRAKFNHSVQTGSLYSPLFTASISAEYVVPRIYDVRISWWYFWRAVQARAALALKNSAAVVGGKKRVIIPRSFRMEESDAYGEPTARYSVSYTFLSDRNTLLAASGLWTKLPDTDYAQWSQSMQQVWSSRGFDGLGMGAGEAVMTLCNPSKPLASNVLKGGGFGNRVALGAAGFQNPFPYPDPDTSWLYFANYLTAQRLDETVELKPLPLQEILPATLRSLPSPQPDDPLAGQQAVLQSGGFQGGQQAVLQSGGVGGGAAIQALRGGTPQLTGVADTAPEASAAGTFGDNGLLVGYDQVTGLPIPSAEVRAAPSFYVWMQGAAIRAGYDVTPPDLASVGGKLAVPASDQRCFWGRTVAAEWFGVPIVVARWCQRWLVLGTPAQIGLPGTPMP